MATMLCWTVWTAPIALLAVYVCLFGWMVTFFYTVKGSPMWKIIEKSQNIHKYSIYKYNTGFMTNP